MYYTISNPQMNIDFIFRKLCQLIPLSTLACFWYLEFLKDDSPIIFGSESQEYRIKVLTQTICLTKECIAFSPRNISSVYLF